MKSNKNSSSGRFDMHSTGAVGWTNARAFLNARCAAWIIAELNRANAQPGMSQAFVGDSFAITGR
jgi:hypothetical protein